jgi:hypothetical protein
MKEIKLTQGKSAWVDDEDYDLVSGFNWHVKQPVNGYCYAARSFRVNGKVKTQLMIELILGKTKPNECYFYWDKNSLNLIRTNISIADRKAQARYRKPDKNSTSKYKGVFKSKYRINYASPFRACVGVNGGEFLGWFKTEIEAAKAYNEKAKELFGDFALLNEI